MPFLWREGQPKTDKGISTDKNYMIVAVLNFMREKNKLKEQAYYTPGRGKIVLRK